MSATQTENGAAPKGKRIAGKSTADLLGAELAPAVDMKPGQYPAILLKWGDETFFLPSKFHSKGVQEKMEAYFAVRNTAPEAEGQVRILRVMITPPTKGIHPKSGAYKLLKPLAADDEKLWDGKRDNIKQGVKLSQFCGRTCFVVIEEGKNGFSNITGVNLAPVGVSAPYPSMDEGMAALADSEHDEEEIGEPEVPRAGSQGGVPF